MQMGSISARGIKSVEEAPGIAPPAEKPAPSVEKKIPAPEIVLPDKKTETVRSFDQKMIPGTTSIKSVIQNKVEEPGQESISSTTTEEPPVSVSGFSQDQLEKTWEEFIKTLQVDSPHFYNTLKHHKPLLKEDFMVEFCVDNKLLEEELNQKRNELLDFLRTRLENDKINFQTVVQETTRTIKPYTDREKFNRMAEKNPALKEMKDQLDLGIE
jgi:DNA polymerase-3 subunit gamma/tau